jgi:hypothetical protein
MAGFLAESPEEIIRYASILRAVESAGGAVACKLSRSTLSYSLQNIIGKDIC